MTKPTSERAGNRLSKIVTRTRRRRHHGLGDGTRTTKDSLRIDAIGEVDELTVPRRAPVRGNCRTPCAAP